MADILALLAAPLGACLVLVGIHCHLGIHVLMRGVIFVDLALAQMAALGATVAVLAGFAPGSLPAVATSLLATLAGAAFFALVRFRDQRVPQEAVIGIVYAVAAAATILAVSRSAVDRAEVETVLVGRLLFLDWSDVAKAALLYGAVGVLHWFWRRPLLRLSADHATGRLENGRRLWDFVFYASFGVVVTSSVSLAGVLPVFAFLVIPATCASMFARGHRPRLLLGWAFGLLGSLLGLGASALWDWDTGAAVVTALGVVFAGSLVGAHRRGSGA